MDPLHDGMAAILIVADEPQVLGTLAGELRPHFRVQTAAGADEGLRALQDRGPFTVVISGFQLPGTDGATFLARVREVAPGAVRVLLARHSHIDAAIDAVNRGFIFRLLMTPCPHEALRRTIDDAVAQARLGPVDPMILSRKLDETTAQLLHAERLAGMATTPPHVAREIGNLLSALRSAVGFIRGRAADSRVPADEDLEVLDWVDHRLAHHALRVLRGGPLRPPLRTR
ncbi:MAG: response regulator [Myxococcales bacterium]|nr:response regulator [Myxococcales bacterium]